RRAITAVLALSALLAASPPSVLAEIYRYVDERGSSFYVEGLENVPERFRRGAVPVGMRNAPAAAPAPTPTAGGPAAASPARAPGRGAPPQRARRAPR